MFKKFVVAVVAATTMWAVAGAAPAMSAPSPSPAPKATSLTKAIKGQPPQSGTKSTLATCAPECLGYAGQKYDVPTSVITATKTTSRIAMPSRAVGDSHTLAETAVLDNVAVGQRNIIEVGWNIDPGINGGSDQPYLFVFAWYTVAGVQYSCGYNAGGASTCGYLDNASNPINAGSNINADLGTEQSFEIYHYAPSSAWIINYKGVQVGRYPDNLNHGVSFATANQVQNFGEVAADDFPSCSNMGSGNFPNTNLTYPTHGTEFKGFNIASGGSYSAANYTGIIQNQPTSWTVYPYADGAFRYGGPGAGSQLYSPTACP